MPGIARIGDIGQGTCPCHDDPQFYTTIFVTGAESVITNQAGTAIIGTVGVASCGHSTIALTGSSTVFAESQGVHRLGDIGENCGTYQVITASPDVFANDNDGG